MSRMPARSEVSVKPWVGTWVRAEERIEVSIAENGDGSGWVLEWYFCLAGWVCPA